MALRVRFMSVCPWNSPSTLAALSRRRRYSEKVLGHDPELSLQSSSALAPLQVAASGKRGYDAACHKPWNAEGQMP